MRFNHIAPPEEKQIDGIKKDTILNALLTATNAEIDTHVDNKVSITVSNLAEANANFLEIRKILKILLKLSVYVAKKVLKLI